MSRLHKSFVMVALMLTAASQALALAAVVEVNENGWYQNEKATRYGGTSFTRFYTPLPVFFEGWKSNPREDIVDWVWDFGDGAPPFHGFNAAHIYETPGSFTATLTVVTRDGQTAQATIAIEALQSAGKTYYVDSAIGDDANVGISQDAPWKTATKAFTGMNSSRYKPGDRVLFRRGQTFDFEAGVVMPAGGMGGYGYYFGAFGEGPKPIIKHVGTSTEVMIKLGGNYLAFWGVVDLEFDCRSAEGAVSSFLIGTACSANLYILRCDIHHHFQAVGMNGDHLARQITNIYIIGSNIHDSVGVDAMHLYTKASRYANIDSTFDMCDDHVGYHSYLDKAIFSGNVYSRWAFGRLAIRSCGVTDAAHPTNNVHIINNQFLGWVDPKIDTWAHTGRGVRYNLCAVELGPNKGLDQFMEYGLIEKNVFKDVEKFIEVGVWEHVVIRNNTFSTASGSAGNVRFQIGHPFEHRPVKDIQVYDNVISSNENRAGTAAIFFINAYVGQPYPGRSLQEDIHIARNRVNALNGDARLITMGTQNTAQIAEVTSNANTFYYGTTQTDRIFQCGGTYNLAGATYNIGEWRLLTGNDRATLVLPPNSQVPLPGAASSPAQCDTAPIPVSYEGALCVNASGLKAVHLWARKDGGEWTDTGLSSTAARDTFLYTGVSDNGTYDFSTVAEDNSGLFSPAPTGMGHTTTAYQALGGADTTLPWPATTAAAAFASAGPIAVHYSGASDMGGSGLKAVHLWVRKNDGVWVDSGLSQTATEGDFQYADVSGDGVYHFATRSEDNAGNLSPEPTGTGDVSTVFDTLPPAAGTLNAPGLVKSAGTLSVTYSGAGDGGSGLKSVVLWVRKDSGAWASTGLTSALASGAFGYAPEGGGVFYFDLVAVDNAGLSSPTPTGDGQGHILQDLDPPATGAVTAPEKAESKPIAVEYSGVSDALSGVKAVRLWVKKGAAGAWTDSGLSSEATADTFAYSGVTDNDTYYFGVEAEDNAGNTSGAPTGSGAAATAYGLVFTAGQASSPATASTSPVTVTYSGAYNSNDNGISFVYLWYKKGAAGVWTDSGLSQTTGSGTFGFAPSSSDTYYFALQAQNSAGEKTAAPAGAGDCSTIYDTVAPAVGTLDAPAMSKTLPIEVTYSGVSDSGAGLESVTLWARKYPAAWYATSLTSTAESGTFSFSQTGGSGTYCFALVATDKSGLTSAAPAGWGLDNVKYDVTLPLVGTVTAPATASTSPIAVSYTGASDALTGLKAVYLWSKKGAAGAWAKTSLSLTTATGTFQFSELTGSETYYFGIQAEDNVGNLSAAPSGSGGANTVYQGDLSAGVAASPANATASPIAVTYGGATASAKSVYLWFKKGAAGAWTDSGLTATGASGSFAFANATGDDTYYFATQAENTEGVRSAAPSADGHTRTILDATAPAPGTPVAPATAKTSPIAVTYSGASDAGSGLKSVTLWAKKDAAAWSATTLSSTAGSGSFSYAPAEGSGVYRLAVVALDNAGNASIAPSGDGQAVVAYDVDAPKLGTLTAPATSDKGPIAVSFAGAEDTVSGLKSVGLWVKKGTAGTWTPTSLTSTAASGSFDYNDMSGNDTYSFALQAEDNAGNLSAVPAGDGAAATAYNRTLTAGTVTAAAYSKTKPIRVTYSGASDSGGVLKSVHLWYRKGAAGAWTDSGLTATGADGGIDFAAVSGDDTYFFAVQAENDKGEKSPAPSGDGATKTTYDTTAAAVGTVQAPRSVNKVPFTVVYDAITDAGSGVKQVILWVKEGRNGAWTDSGLRSATAPGGAFELNNLSRDAKYYFFTQVEDNAGNVSAAPTDASVF